MNEVKGMRDSDGLNYCQIKWIEQMRNSGPQETAYPLIKAIGLRK